MKKLLLAGIAALSVLGASAVAEPNALGCFTRTYDRAHLARHPDQLVTAVKLRIYRRPPDKPDLADVLFDVQFKVRGKNKPLINTGLCVPEAGGLRCSIECDGGGVNVIPRARDAMMYLDRIRLTDTCDADFDDGPDLTGGKDDRVFRLDRVNDAACTDMTKRVQKMLDNLEKKMQAEP
jgi:hypothetical protein